MAVGQADIGRRWGSLVIVAVLVALALGATPARVAGSRQAGTAFERYFADEHVPDILVSTQSDRTASQVEALSSDPRIAEVERAETVVIAPAPIALSARGPAFLDGRWGDFLRTGSWLGVHLRSRHDTKRSSTSSQAWSPTEKSPTAATATSPLDRAGHWQQNALTIAAVIVGLAGLLVVSQALSRHLAAPPGRPPSAQRDGAHVWTGVGRWCHSDLRIHTVETACRLVDVMPEPFRPPCVGQPTRPQKKRTARPSNHLVVTQSARRSLAPQGA